MLVTTAAQAQKFAWIEKANLEVRLASKLLKQGWLVVGDDLISPMFTAQLRQRMASAESMDMTWEDMVEMVKAEEQT